MSEGGVSRLTLLNFVSELQAARYVQWQCLTLLSQQLQKKNLRMPQLQAFFSI